MGAHLIDGEFQSDKYPTTPRGKVPLSVADKSAQDLLWLYAQRRRPLDPEFSADLETALRNAGFAPTPPIAMPGGPSVMLEEIESVYRLKETLAPALGVGRIVHYYDHTIEFQLDPYPAIVTRVDAGIADLADLTICGPGQIWHVRGVSKLIDREHEVIQKNYWTWPPRS
jgi:hypothetical protein